MTPNYSSGSSVIDASLPVVVVPDLGFAEKSPRIPNSIQLPVQGGGAVTSRTGSLVEIAPRQGYVRAYTLDEGVAAGLKKLADADCYKCQGSGIKDWRVQGTKARVCRCVLAKQDAVAPAEG